MFFSLLGLLTGLGGAISSVTSAISNVQIAKINADTDEKRAELQRDEDALHDRRAVLVAEAGSRINAVARFLLALGPILYVLKYYAWDKVVGSFLGCAGPGAPVCRVFMTDGLSTQMTVVMTAVLGFYFLYSRRDS